MIVELGVFMQTYKGVDKMKKLIAILLTLVMVLGLAACGAPATSTTPDAPASTPNTEVVTPDNTDAPATEPQVSMEAVTYETVAEYEQKLHEMGFVEVLMADTMVPTEMLISEDAFQLTFSYTYEGKTVDNWHLYGVKADAPANISTQQADMYENCDIMDYAEYYTDMYHLNYIHVVDYMLYNLTAEKTAPTFAISLRTMHYVETSNMYNMWCDEDAMTLGMADPAILPLRNN